MTDELGPSQQMKTYTFMNKSEWGDGPWQKEPDKAQWIDELTGLDCLIVRNDYGALCGYVGVPEGHPAFGKCYTEYRGADVHGGLSFAGPCDDATESEHGGICHHGDVANETVWWFGFDCAHSMDYQPRMFLLTSTSKFEFGGIYRDFLYVTKEVCQLAEQLAALEIEREKT